VAAETHKVVSCFRVWRHPRNSPSENCRFFFIRHLHRHFLFRSNTLKCFAMTSFTSARIFIIACRTHETRSCFWRKMFWLLLSFPPNDSRLFPSLTPNQASHLNHNNAPPMANIRPHLPRKHNCHNRRERFSRGKMFRLAGRV
jgi:hypothetical protein